MPGMIRNIPENPRDPQAPQTRAQAALQRCRPCITPAGRAHLSWEDKFKRLLLRFERIQRRHYGMKLLGYTLINLRAFCGG